MPRSSAYKIGNFTRNPHQGQVGFHQLLGDPVKFGDADHTLRQYRIKMVFHDLIVAASGRANVTT
jgi:hypothetical protein